MGRVLTSFKDHPKPFSENECAVGYIININQRKFCFQMLTQLLKFVIAFCFGCWKVNVNKALKNKYFYKKDLERWFPFLKDNILRYILLFLTQWESNEAFQFFERSKSLFFSFHGLTNLLCIRLITVWKLVHSLTYPIVT